VHRATCSRFETISACDRQTDGQTDGIAIASTALAMQALRRTVKKKAAWITKMFITLSVVKLDKTQIRNVRTWL